MVVFSTLFFYYSPILNAQLQHFTGNHKCVVYKVKRFALMLRSRVVEKNLALLLFVRPTSVKPVSVTGQPQVFHE
jgi:hypothetical protein